MLTVVISACHENLRATPGTQVSVLTTPARQRLSWNIEHTIIGIHIATICGAEKGQQPSVASQSNSTGHGDAGEPGKVQTLPWKVSHVPLPLAARCDKMPVSAAKQGREFHGRQLTQTATQTSQLQAIPRKKIWCHSGSAALCL